MGDDILVTIGAQIDDLISGFNAAAEGVSDSLGKIETSVTSASDVMENQLAPAIDNVNKHLEDISETSESLGGALDEIKEKFQHAFEASGAAVAYEAVEKVADAVESLGARATQMQAMSNVLQVTTDQFQAMQLAASAGGTSIEVFARATERLEATLTKARDGSGEAIVQLLKLGITTEQINDPLFQVNDLLATLKEKLEGGTTAQSEMNELVAQFGPRAALAANAIKEYDGSQEGVKGAIEEVNGLNKEQIQTLHEMAEWWEHLGTSIKNTASAALVGAHDMMTAGKQAQQSMASSGGASDGESQYQEIMQQQATARIEAAETTADAEIAAMQTVGPVSVEIDGIITQSMLDSMKQQIAATKEGTEQRIAAEQQYAKAAAEYYKNGNVKEVEAANTQLIASQRQYYAAVQKFAEDWASEDKEITAKDSQEKQKLNLEVIKSAQKVADESYTLASQSAKNQLDVITQGIDAQEAVIKDSYKTGQISNQQELQSTTQLVQQKLAAQLNYYETLKSLANDNQVEIQKLNAEEVKANQAAGSSIVAAQNTYAQNFKQTWQNVFNTVGSAFASNISKMIMGGQTWQKSMQNIANSILTAILNMFLKWVAQQAISMIETKLLGKQAAASQVSANAASAATGAMASVAAIPYYGWAMAPEVGASTFAEAMGYEASIASAAGGMEVPSDQLIQAHKDEMVLPARLSNGIRDMISANGAAGGGGRGGNMSATFQSLDSKSVEDHFKSSRNRDAFAKGMRKAYDTGHPSLR